MALITRTAMVDDDGSGETGTVVNNDWKQEFYNQIDALAASPSLDLWTVIDSTATGTVTNWAPGLSGHTIIFWNGAADITINSFAGGVPGQMITLRNNSGAGPQIVLPHYVGSTTNSLINFASSAPTRLAVGGTATYIYKSADGWRMIAHEQGGWITPPFNAADYTAVTGSWTVGAGGVLLFNYRVSGRAMTVSIYINASVVSAATASLYVKIPGGFKYGGGTYTMALGSIFEAGGSERVAEMYLSPANDTQIILRNLISANTIPAYGGTTVKFSGLTFPVA